jgi:hypothetical protein
MIGRAGRTVATAVRTGPSKSAQGIGGQSRLTNPLLRALRFRKKASESEPTEAVRRFVEALLAASKLEHSGRGYAVRQWVMRSANSAKRSLLEIIDEKRPSSRDQGSGSSKPRSR